MARNDDPRRRTSPPRPGGGYGTGRGTGRYEDGGDTSDRSGNTGNDNTGGSPSPSSGGDSGGGGASFD